MMALIISIFALCLNVYMIGFKNGQNKKQQQPRIILQCHCGGSRRRKGGGRKRMAHYRDLVQNQKGLVREWCDSTPVTLATEGWKWALKVHEQGEVDSNRWNRCRLLDRAITASRL